MTNAAFWDTHTHTHTHTHRIHVFFYITDIYFQARSFVFRRCLYCSPSLEIRGSKKSCQFSKKTYTLTVSRLKTFERFFSVCTSICSNDLFSRILAMWRKMFDTGLELCLCLLNNRVTRVVAFITRSIFTLTVTIMVPSVKSYVLATLWCSNYLSRISNNVLQKFETLTWTFNFVFWYFNSDYFVWTTRSDNNQIANIDKWEHEICISCPKSIVQHRWHR